MASVTWAQHGSRQLSAPQRLTELVEKLTTHFERRPPLRDVTKIQRLVAQSATTGKIV
jgi:hypothetical protein